MAKDKTCLSYWFPLICAAGVPVPATQIVRTDIPLIVLCDGHEPVGWSAFLAELKAGCRWIGLPAFLRTGFGSGKHDWDRCCHLRDIDKLDQHVANLVEWSNTVDMMGLPTDVWAVREMLPVEPLAVLPHYGNMPLVQEWRVFVRDGKVECLHSYWPKDAIGRGMPDGAPDEEVDRLYNLAALTSPDLFNDCLELAEFAGQAVGGGYWSVDVLPTKRGLYVTDMAAGERSWHWPGCPHGPQPETEPGLNEALTDLLEEEQSDDDL
jgi:hypothetical protein